MSRPSGFCVLLADRGNSISTTFCECANAPRKDYEETVCICTRIPTNIRTDLPSVQQNLVEKQVTTPPTIQLQGVGAPDVIGFVGLTVVGVVLRHIVFNQVRAWFAMLRR